MTRRISILSVSPSGASLGSFVLAPSTDNGGGDWTPVFQGRYYRNSAGATHTFYNADGTPRPVPAGYQLIEATTFTVTDNPSYNGRYTVYTQAGTLNDPTNPSSVFASGSTTVRVNEPVGIPQNSAHLSNTGFVTNVSTYYIVFSTGVTPAATDFVVVPPGITVENEHPVELVGRNFSGWGEVLQTSMIRFGTNFAGPTAPPNPVAGILWYNTNTNQVSVWNGTGWGALGGGSSVPVDSVRVPFTAIANTPEPVVHNLGITTAPFICHHSFFVDVAGEMYYTLATNVTYVSANRFDVTFSKNLTGIALVQR